jgi:pimeloyl-ACP methyl ester carboxylesterase
VPLLSDDHTVVTPDRHGRGSSDAYRDQHSLLQDVEDLRRLIQLLAEEDKSTLLVAHAANCYIALAAALTCAQASGSVLPSFGR